MRAALQLRTQTHTYTHTTLCLCCNVWRPQLKDMQKEVLRYKRSDGVDLTGGLVLRSNSSPACAELARTPKQT